MIRLRRDGQALVGDSHPEIVLVNSHDGTRAYHMHFGWFRLVCFRHSGNASHVLEEVIAGAHQLVASAEQQAAQLDTFRTRKRRRHQGCVRTIPRR